ncbi:MAG: tRNA 2-thiouridine(34) synthase MnmA [Dehalococcoidia bacterium]
MSRPRVVVAMSGGVDSSVAAALLAEQGYEVVGVTMRLWTEDDPSAARHHRRCCSVEDTDDARAACDVLDVPHYVLNLEREFAAGVVDTFVQEYTRGRTPNPCLECNDRVKFRPLLEHALALEADHLATGHYARVRRAERGYELWRAADETKDQSYVLYTLGQRELERTLFPLGDLPKDEVRAIARRHALPNADKPDSADICFIPSGDYRSFVRERVGVTPGRIVDTAGNAVGDHEGIAGYTVGQRRGLPARGGGEPLFVLELDAGSNEVIVGPQEELLADGLIADELSFVAGEAAAGAFRAQARIRYRSTPAAATVTVRGSEAEVRFERPQRAVTPGQAVVFYDGDRVLGGGKTLRRLD